MERVVVRAPAKVNLGLLVGRPRADGMHELRSLFCPLALSDRIVVEPSARAVDGVVCEGVAGPNLVSATLDGLRARGWSPPPLRVEIDKRIPVAAGMGGGSADAAAILRLAAADGVAGVEDLALALGADVPFGLTATFALVGGVGERIEPLPRPASFALVLIPSQEGLATGEVFAEADRIGAGRDPDELDELGDELRRIAGAGISPLEYAHLLHNDLEAAAISLRPQVREALDALEQVGAARAMVTGSGPTVFGLFENLDAADAAAAELPPRFAGSLVTAPRSLS
ncbi:4-(cytidine 5'-diphospho)-2-C-methyl-D-erythritol kinase [Thermoleophilia bacterium SCSIO 60948]|nr:4-(cytidine 5'-diphospho)-2-C-methyl-D-erythritol kinase [Thermoleophilia bacterium SCSIO 60948]